MKMTKKQQNLWIIAAIVIVVLIVVMIALPKKDKVVDEDLAQEKFDMPEQVKVEDLPKVPEVELKEIIIEEEPVQLAPGTSAITSEGEVLAETGEVADNQAVIGTKSAPKQSRALEEEEVPEEALILTVTRERGIEPSEFTVKTGQVVTLVIFSGDGRPKTFKFADKSLGAVAVGVNPNQKKAITFKAPNSPGEYQFMCDKRRGEIGKMIVVAE